MMTNKEIYEKEININKEYKISILQFLTEIQQKDITEVFLKSLLENDDYYTAVDFTIPLIMVKYFKKVGF